MTVEIAVKEDPATVSYKYGATLYLKNINININAVNKKKAIVPLMELLVNGTSTLSNFKISDADGTHIKFHVAIPVLHFAAYNNSMPSYMISLLNSGITYVLQQVVLPKFNKEFKGITIPAVKGLQMSEVEVAFHNDAIVLGMDVDAAKKTAAVPKPEFF